MIWEIVALGILLIIVHELGHAFAGIIIGKFKRFGFILKYFTPYVEFKTPLNIKQAIFGFSSGLIFSAPLAFGFDVFFPHEISIYLLIWFSLGSYDLLMLHTVIKKIELNPFFKITDKTTFKINWDFYE